MWESLRDYSVAVVRWWWVLVTGAIAAVVGIILDIWQDLALPIWLWASLGFVGLVVAQFLAFHEQRERTAHLETELPDMELGEPRREPNETLTRTHMVPQPSSSSTASPPEQRVVLERLGVVLFRIPVLNNGAYAPHVFVKLMKTEPPIPRGLPAATLHIAGDNPGDHVSFGESFPLHRQAEVNQAEVYIDVISFSKSEPRRFFLYKIASPDAAEEAQLDADRYVFTIVAFAGNASTRQDYRVDKDSSGGLTMSRVSA
jgi:hypothetical protein